MGNKENCVSLMAKCQKNTGHYVKKYVYAFVTEVKK